MDLYPQEFPFQGPVFFELVNNGSATVGFSTFFLFPSGAAPSLPSADGAISLISFTVNRVGAGGTQLLAGASVNYS